MTDEELHQWQRNAIVWCEFDNFLNSIIDGSLRDNVSEILEESAINMAIESHGIQRGPRRVVIPNMQVLHGSSVEDDLNFFDQQAISAAIEFQGLGMPPPS